MWPRSDFATVHCSMPIESQFDRERNVLFVTFGDGVTDAELEAFAMGLARDGQVPPGRDELFDLRQVTGTTVESGTLERIARQFDRTDVAPERSRVAFVASGDVAYGLSRMYQVFRSRSPVDLRVFRDMEEAKRWLGLA